MIDPVSSLEHARAAGGLPRVLVAGIGNIFLGDDAFGVEVARRLLSRSASHPLPPTVHVEDFGIRGLDLTYRLLEDYDVAILIDAAPRGKPPGTLSLIEPDPRDLTPPDAGAVAIDTHDVDPARVLRLVAAMGGRLRRVLVLACEPRPLPPADADAADDDMHFGLSPPVQAAVDEAVTLIDALLADLILTETHTSS